MNPMFRRAGLCAGLLLGACASETDRFYTLTTLPQIERAGASAPSVHAVLSVKVPTLVDRSEMVINTSDTGIMVLDHERWTPALSDQVSQTLARDIEKRRSDVLVGDRGFDQGGAPPVIVKVDIVRMSARQGGRASIEAHWRIVDESASLDEIAGDTFDAPLAATDYASVAAAYSQALSALAERLAGRIRPH
ncbi:MAG: uncharacterized protein QOD56_1674 [Gammaproteobacteria bacterium]|nr:uncharacterized protein [Gammaproteobacteria bacterium]